MEEQRKKEVAATIVGFGLAKAATSLGYLSAMGSVGQSVGFVTELWFMFASEAASIIVASLVIALACRGAVKPGRLRCGRALPRSWRGSPLRRFSRRLALHSRWRRFWAFSTALGKRWFRLLGSIDIFHARERALSYMHGVRFGFAGFHCRWLFLFRVRPCVRFGCVRHGGLFACLLSRVGCIGA